MTEVVPRELRPEVGPFMFSPIASAVIGYGVVGVGLAVGLTMAEQAALAAIGPAVWLVGVAFTVYAVRVAYRKELYSLHEGHLVCRKGSLLSDQTTELDLRNITHVKLRLPWIRHMLFKVGDLIVESAGSGESVRLGSIKDPEQVYADLRVLMQRNGYSLEQGELLHEEQPDPLGVVLECLGLLLALAVALLFAGLEAMGAFEPGGAWTEASAFDRYAGPVFQVLGVFGVVSSLGAVVIHYLDMRRRSYRVYDDMVVYEEGFLTRDNAYIPFENLADANTTRTFIDQLIGLYDVQVSCQGSGQEVKFRRLRGGPELEAAIDRLVAAAREKPSPSEQREESQAAEGGLDLPARESGPELVAPEQAWTATLKMDMKRALLPLMWLFPLLPAWFFASLAVAIRAACTTFEVRGSSIKSSYKFLNTNEREFAYDKVTGLVVTETILDRFFGTVSVRVWSIGSSRPMDLSYLSRSLLNLEALQRQVGIPAATPAPYDMPAKFELGTWLRAELPTTVLVGLMVLGVGVLSAAVEPLIALAIPLLLAFPGVYYVYQGILSRRQRFEMHEHHVYARTGWLHISEYFVRASNVKKLKFTQYPGTDAGRVQVFVAGEMRMVQGQQNAQAAQGGQQGGTIPYAFTVHYLPGISRLERLLDDMLLRRVAVGPGAAPAEELAVLEEDQPAVANAMVLLVFVSVLSVVTIPLLLVTVPLTVGWMRRKRYRVEAGRVVSSYGWVYVSQESVLFNRIDSLRNQQGVLNKAFGNGEVRLFTAGSSSPDLVLAAAPRYQALYDEVRKHYGKR